MYCIVKRNKKSKVKKIMRMPNTGSRRGTPTSREMPADTHLRHLTTEVMCLRFGQLNLVTNRSRSVLLARQTTALKDRPNASTPTIPNGQRHLNVATSSRTSFGHQRTDSRTNNRVWMFHQRTTGHAKIFYIPGHGRSHPVLDSDT